MFPLAANVPQHAPPSSLRRFQVWPLTLIYFEQTGLGDCSDCENTNRDGFGEFYLVSVQFE